MKIEPATLSDHKILSDITKKSKAYWKYTEDQLHGWLDSLTITDDYIANNFVYKLCDNQAVIGYYSYKIKEATIILLDNFFILPEYIGQGFGKTMMEDFLERIDSSHITKIELESDPNAELFYIKFGFKTITLKETSDKERFIPLMEKRYRTPDF
nr:GNAT family N-acetyltransferase [uncultured Flavobacterium sp.]